MKTKLDSEAYRKAIAAARKSGGKEAQAHWEARLNAAVKRPPKPAKPRSVATSQPMLGNHRRIPRGASVVATQRLLYAP